MKKFNSFRNRQNGFEDLGSGTAEAAKTKKSWWKVPGIILVILVIAIFAFNSTYQIREQEQAVLITLGQAKAVTDPGLHFKIPFSSMYSTPISCMIHTARNSFSPRSVRK